MVLRHPTLLTDCLPVRRLLCKVYSLSPLPLNRKTKQRLFLLLLLVHLLSFSFYVLLKSSQQQQAAGSSVLFLSLFQSFLRHFTFNAQDSVVHHLTATRKKKEEKTRFFFFDLYAPCETVTNF